MLQFLLRIGLMVGLLLATFGGSAAVAQQPPPTHYELLDLSTSLDTADLVRHVALPQVLASVEQRADQPPKYDYRHARKVERTYRRHRRYYNRLNRKDTRKIRQANLQKGRAYERDLRKEDRHRKEAVVNPNVLVEFERKRR